MRFEGKWLMALCCVAVFGLVSPGGAWAQDSVSRLRFLSFALTDHPPTASEAKALVSGEVDLPSLVDQMLASDGHRERVMRYFNDWFGTQRYAEVGVDASFIVLDETGVYQPVDVFLEACDPDDAVETSAWWSDEPVMICPRWISEDLCIEVIDDEEDEEDEEGEEGEEDEEDEEDGEPEPYLECGGDMDTGRPCGPELIGCFPVELSLALSESVSQEFAHRAWHAYSQGWSWMALLGGDRFYGNRLLYFYYLWTQTLYPGFSLGAEERQTLLSLPLIEPEEQDFPSGPERAGVVTSPTFLTRFNNFRSRVRALTNQPTAVSRRGWLHEHRSDQRVPEPRLHRV